MWSGVGMSLTDRAGALAGIAGSVLVFVFVTLAEPAGDPDDPSAVIANAAVDNRDSARVGAYVALLAAFSFVVFVSRLHSALRRATGPESWLPTAALVGGILLIVWLLVEAGFTFAASEPESYGGDTQVAKLFTLWSWNSANLLAPAFSALVGASTFVGFTARTFPPWFRWTGAVLLALILLIVTVLSAPGLATAPGTLWIFLASVVLATDRAADM